MKTTEEKKVFTKVKCPSCDSSQVLFQLRKDGYYCRVCGHSWKKEKV